MIGDRIAIIGLGLMGSSMAQQLAADGLRLHGFDPDPARMSAFESKGGETAGSPAEAVAGCWAAVLSLPNSDVSKEVCLGEGGLSTSGISPLYVYDTTTGLPTDAIEIAMHLADVGVAYCDTTVSGNAEIAGRGELVVMVGGPLDSFRKGIPIFQAIGRSYHHVGEVGAGSRMKLLVNHALTIHRMALAETLVVAELAGMDLDRSLEVLRDGLSYSKAMDVWGDRMIAADHDPPFARLRQTSKDAKLIVEHGHDLGAPVALVEVVASVLDEGEKTGLAEMDNSSIIEVIRRRAGIGKIG